MRIVDLRLVEDSSSTLGLHPNLTVVTGVPARARAPFAIAIAELLRGSDEAPLIALVDEGGTTAELRPGIPPRLSRPVDLLVRAEDLPHSHDRADLAPLVDEELRKATVAQIAAKASLQALEASATVVRGEHRAATASLEQARAAITQARHDLDPYAAAALDAAVSQAARVEVELGLGPGACRADTLETVKDRIVLLETQHRDIVAALEMLASADPEPVADALDLVRVVTATGPIAPPEVLRLADEWASISEHLSALEAKFAAEEGGVQSVSDRLEAARANMARCEANLAPMPVRAEDVQALEAAHEAVLAAERKASSRLGGNRARRALDEAIAEQQVYLDRLGYPTWSAWIMGAPLLDATAENARILDQARRELDEATAAWGRLTTKLEADPEFRSLLDRLERVLEAAYAIVGDVEDVEQALRDVRVDPGPPPCSEAEAREELAAAMGAAGFAVDDAAALDDLRVHAERWLAEIRTVAALRRQLEIDREQCSLELGRAQETFERIEALGPAEPGDGFGTSRLNVARAELVAAEERAMRHRTAIARVAHLVAEAEGLAEIERQLRIAADAKGELLDVTRSLSEAADERVRTLAAAGGWQAPTDEEEAVMDVLDVRIASARLAAGGGSVPIVLDDALVGLQPDATETVLGWLENAAADTQIVYVTDEPAVLAWAARRNPARVGVVDGASLTGGLVGS
jgi:uncharacterized protein YhaN